MYSDLPFSATLEVSRLNNLLLHSNIRKEPHITFISKSKYEQHHNAGLRLFAQLSYLFESFQIYINATLNLISNKKTFYN